MGTFERLFPCKQTNGVRMIILSVRFNNSIRYGAYMSAVLVGIKFFLTVSFPNMGLHRGG